MLQFGVSSLCSYSAERCQCVCCDLYLVVVLYDFRTVTSFFLVEIHIEFEKFIITDVQQFLSFNAVCLEKPETVCLETNYLTSYKTVFQICYNM